MLTCSFSRLSFLCKNNIRSRRHQIIAIVTPSFPLDFLLVSARQPIYTPTQHFYSSLLWEAWRNFIRSQYERNRQEKGIYFITTFFLDDSIECNQTETHTILGRKFFTSGGQTIKSAKDSATNLRLESTWVSSKETWRICRKHCTNILYLIARWCSLWID